jgi:hypothetical protein
MWARYWFLKPSCHQRLDLSTVPQRCNDLGQAISCEEPVLLSKEKYLHCDTLEVMGPDDSSRVHSCWRCYQDAHTHTYKLTTSATPQQDKNHYLLLDEVWASARARIACCPSVTNKPLELCITCILYLKNKQKNKKHSCHFFLIGWQRSWSRPSLSECRLNFNSESHISERNLGMGILECIYYRLGVWPRAVFSVDTFLSWVHMAIMIWHPAHPQHSCSHSVLCLPSLSYCYCNMPASH